jgi:hypothetical protein
LAGVIFFEKNSDIVKSSRKRAGVKTAWPAFTFSQMTFSLSAFQPNRKTFSQMTFSLSAK